MASATQVLTFNDTEFDIVDVHNVPWLRGPQIAGALGYSDQGAAIAKIYDRNQDEFTEDMTALVKLPDLNYQTGSPGQMREVRIFSPRGCYLIGMLARTEKAKDFRRWVLDVLEGRPLPLECGTGRGEGEGIYSDLEFAGVRLSVHVIDGAPWFQGREIAEALGYAHPKTDISGLHRRHADKFTEEETRVGKVSTGKGPAQIARLFSPLGLKRIAELACTARSEAFRRWVLDVLAGGDGKAHYRGMPVPSLPSPHGSSRSRPPKEMTMAQRLSAHRLRLALLKAFSRETNPEARKALLRQVDDISSLIGIPSMGVKNGAQ